MSNPKFSLTERKYDVIYFGGVAVELNLSFDNILLMFQLFDDPGVRANQEALHRFAHACSRAHITSST